MEIFWAKQQHEEQNVVKNAKSKISVAEGFDLKIKFNTYWFKK